MIWIFPPRPWDPDLRAAADLLTKARQHIAVPTRGNGPWWYTGYEIIESPAPPPTRPVVQFVMCYVLGAPQRRPLTRLALPPWRYWSASIVGQVSTRLGRYRLPKWYTYAAALTLHPRLALAGKLPRIDPSKAREYATIWGVSAPNLAF